MTEMVNQSMTYHLVTPSAVSCVVAHLCSCPRKDASPDLVVQIGRSAACGEETSLHVRLSQFLPICPTTQV